MKELLEKLIKKTKHLWLAHKNDHRIPERLKQGTLCGVVTG